MQFQQFLLAATFQLFWFSLFIFCITGGGKGLILTNNVEFSPVDYGLDIAFIPPQWQCAKWASLKVPDFFLSFLFFSEYFSIDCV